MTTIVITGATGFVGSALARALHGRGHEVVGLARATSDRSRLQDLDLRWIVGDVLEPRTLEDAFAGADVVIHAAGMLGQAGIDEAVYQRLHVDGTNHVLAAVERLPRPPRVLYVSSPGVLGPIDGPPADETAPYAPSNPYERSKAAAEQLVRVYAAQGLPVVITRPEFIYGPGDLHVLGLFTAVARGVFFYVGSGRNTCHPTYIDDAVDGMLRCLEHGRAGEIYHIAGPAPVTFRELATTIAAEIGVAPPRLAVPTAVAWTGALGLEALGRLLRRDVPLSRSGVAFFSENRRFSWQKARDELGYAPQYDLARGVQATVAWYRETGYLDVERVA